jgi:magnesium-transporting ATPase (P-type)
MSVLVNDVISKKYYIFAKGSPEKMLANCSNIMTGSENSETYIKMIKTLSLNGFRTIAMGYR